MELSLSALLLMLADSILRQGALSQDQLFCFLTFPRIGPAKYVCRKYGRYQIARQPLPQSISGPSSSRSASFTAQTTAPSYLCRTAQQKLPGFVSFVRCRDFGRRRGALPGVPLRPGTLIPKPFDRSNEVEHAFLPGHLHSQGNAEMSITKPPLRTA